MAHRGNRTNPWHTDCREKLALAAVLVLFFLLYLTIICVYEISALRDGERVPRSTGAAIVASLLLVVSIFFSAMIEKSTRYTLIYGSLVSIIVLMTWFYLCGIVMIMGNVLNIVLHRQNIKPGIHNCIPDFYQR